MLPQIETITQSLQKMGLIKDPREAAFHPLSGGVSSDIWRVDTPSGAICVKQARRQLRVDAKWLAPVERNSIEATWMRTTGALMPGTVPRVISEDRAASLFAMTYFDPGTYPTWISRLMSGDVDIDFAAEIGTQLARMHAASADSPKLAADFGHDDLFRALRIDPYLITTSERHRDIAARLRELAQTTLETRRTLIHGDVSPKNILVGPAGPVFLDAECAVYGDPAFDIAFCLNHLMLKCMARRDSIHSLLESYRCLAESYMSGISWEPKDALETRAGHLIPALLLARVDGKSPVTYLNEADKATTRQFARLNLIAPPKYLKQLANKWRNAIADGTSSL
jgi:aminoglycoside phosphotransferase (APT) family kinase protein